MTDLANIDRDELAYFLFDRDYSRFNPLDLSDMADDLKHSIQGRELTIKILVVAAIALGVLSSISTVPEFVTHLHVAYDFLPPFFHGALSFVTAIVVILGVDCLQYGLSHMLGTKFSLLGWFLALFIYAMTSVLALGIMIDPMLAAINSTDNGFLQVFWGAFYIFLGVGRTTAYFLVGLFESRARRSADSLDLQYDKRKREIVSQYNEQKREEWEENRQRWTSRAVSAIKSNQLPSEFAKITEITTTMQPANTGYADHELTEVAEAIKEAIHTNEENVELANSLVRGITTASTSISNGRNSHSATVSTAANNR